MSRDNGLPGYDRWKTRSDLDDAAQGDEPPEIAVYTESDVALAVEDMRAKCEATAREARYKVETDDLESGYNAACEDIADSIAALGWSK